MNETPKQSNLPIHNRTPESTETRINLQELMDAVRHSYEHPHLWPNDFESARWRELQPDQPMRSSVYAAAYQDQPMEGEAYSIQITNRSVVLVEQGSCVFVPASSADIVASFGFSRCIGYSHRTCHGVFFAHITEHDETLCTLRERLMMLYGSGVEQVYLPELQTDQLKLISAKAKAEMSNLREYVREKRIDTIPYPWSDIPPTSNAAEYSSGIILSPMTAQIIPLVVHAADAQGNAIYKLDIRKR